MLLSGAANPDMKNGVEEPPPRLLVTRRDTLP